MEQVKYTEKQLLVLEIIKEIDELFAPSEKYSSEYEIRTYNSKINKLKAKYGIVEKHKTLKEYIQEHECGAYHDFIFEMEFGFNKVKIQVSTVSEFARYYNPQLLERYYIVDAKTEDNGGDCENYNCKHYLKLAPKDD